MIYRIIASTLLVSVAFQTTLADPITYQQVGQVQGTRAFNDLPLPATANVVPLPKPKAGQQQQEVRPQESSKQPEFVRLSDGRLVKYGPGVVCDAGCVEAVPLGKLPVARSWYVLPPLLAAGALCAAFCRSGENVSTLTQAAGAIVIQPSPSPRLATTPTPPPAEIPEPGTLALLGIGPGALLARKRLSERKKIAGQ